MHDSRSNYFFVGIALLPSILLGIGLITLSRFDFSAPFNTDVSAPSAASKSSTRRITRYPMSIRGLNARTFRENRQIFGLKADLLTVNPRKYSIFRIRTLNEATLYNGKIENFIGDDPSLSDVGFLAFFDSVLSFEKKNTEGESGAGRNAAKKKIRFRGLGIITRGVINNLDWRIYKKGRPYFLIKAQKAEIDFKKKKTKLFTCSLENALLKKTISGKLIIWDDRKKYFYIPKSYYLISPTGEKSGGQGTVIRLE